MKAENIVKLAVVRKAKKKRKTRLINTKNSSKLLKDRINNKEEIRKAISAGTKRAKALTTHLKQAIDRNEITRYLAAYPETKKDLEVIKTALVCLSYDSERNQEQFKSLKETYNTLEAVVKVKAKPSLELRNVLEELQEIPVAISSFKTDKVRTLSHVPSANILKEWKLLADDVKKTRLAIEDIKAAEHRIKKETDSTRSIVLSKGKRITGTNALAYSNKIISVKNMVIKDSPIKRTPPKTKKITTISEDYNDPYRNPIASASATTKTLIKSYKISSRLRTLEITDMIEMRLHQKTVRFINKLSKKDLVYIQKMADWDLIEKLKIPSLVIPKAKPKPHKNSPASYGIKPAGIGDLFLIQQKLKRYTSEEIAHIENVLGTEYKTRKTTRKKETEESFTSERELEVDTEKDLQTTTKFSIQKETENTLKSEMGFKIGTSVNANYGVVEVGVNAEFSYSQSSEESTQEASSFMREVTEKTTQSIVEKNKEVLMRKAKESFEEVNEHGFDNKANPKNLRGIYRFVEKEYDNFMVNYGKRVFMEFMIPGPADFYKYAQTIPEASSAALIKPKKPKMNGQAIEPNDLNKYNYQYFMEKYRVEDVTPYPANYKKLNAALSAAPGPDGNIDFATVEEKFTIPKGYTVTGWGGTWRCQGIKDSDFFCDFTVGGRRISSGMSITQGLSGTIPITARGWATAYDVNLVLQCEITDEAITRWQLDTYQKILRAYQTRLAEYEEKLAEKEISEGINIEGVPESRANIIIEAELKKHLIRGITLNFNNIKIGNQIHSNEVFNAAEYTDSHGFPKWNEAERKKEALIVQFFEQALETEKMQFFFYPYHYSHKDEWVEKLKTTDNYHLMEKFMKASYARVLVAIRPSFVKAFLHFLWTSEIWMGDNQPPLINDDLYLAIYDEIKADSPINEDYSSLDKCDETADHPCLVDQWTSSYPTDLVYLQDGDELNPEE